MMRRVLPHPLLSLTLILVWLLLVNSLAPGQILLGLFLGLVIPLATGPFWPGHTGVHRPLTVLRFLGILAYDILTANIAVARLVLAPRHPVRPAFVVMPLTLRTDLAISLLANTICLTPGTVSARLSPDQRELLIHALDVVDPQALVATIRQRYEAPLREIFEPC
jgi:multicomponent K+:H+ antiporter subunit E